MKVFVTLYFGYCPLFWRLHNWGLNNKTSSLHERIKYGDNNPPFQSLLERDRFTVYNDMLSEIIYDFYKLTTMLYGLWNFNSFEG